MDLRLERRPPRPVETNHRMTLTDPKEQFHELSFYTLAHRDPTFIHQHIVDAYTAQHAD